MRIAPIDMAIPRHSVETAVHLAAWRVDVNGDVPVGVLRLEEEQLGGDQVCHGVVYGRAQENDPVFEQPRVDVVGTLSSIGLLNYDRDEISVHLLPLS
jgi:hypothetical protein